MKQDETGTPRGLDPQAYSELPPGATYRPVVGEAESAIEFTFKAILAGIVAGVLFGAANAYLGLRAGLTISTSIPVAVLTVALFRALGVFGVRTGLLEANLSQTVGSASSSVASGVIFTLPALFLWGAPPSLAKMTLLAMCGGLLGVLFMVPLRRFLIVREHGRLPYPEGTACAQVLVAAQAGGARARNVFLGLGVGAFFKFLTGWSEVIRDSVSVKVPFLKKGQLGMEASAALFGVGYILGPRVGSVMVGGGLFAWLVLIPIIAYWGEGRVEPFYPETVQTIAEMGPSAIWNRYVRYIGAGAVAAGGLITLIRSIPTMMQSFKMGASQIRQRMGGGNAAEAPATAAAPVRTDLDLPLKFVGLAVVGVVLVLGLAPQGFDLLQGAGSRLVAALLVAIFAFFFVTVSSRIVGLVGVTSNPTSGMTIATLLGTSSLFLLLGWTGMDGKVAALTVGCVVAIAASIAGDTSQDLKTGFLLGATPRRQQIGELIGVLTSAIFVCWTVIQLNATYGFGTAQLPAPQATLMRLVIDGVLEQSLPWLLVGIGAVIALVAEACKLPSLAFAVGVYLPVSTMVPVFFGGVLRWWLERSAANESDREARREAGVLFGSGLVGGEGLLGVGVAFMAGWSARRGLEPWSIGSEWAGAMTPWLTFGAFVLLAGLFYALSRSREREG